MNRLEFAALPVGHAHRALAFKQDALRERFRFYFQIGARTGGLEKYARRALAHAIAGNGMEQADAFVVAAVEVGAFLATGFLCRLFHDIKNRPPVALRLDAQFTVRAVQRAGPAGIVFVLDEIGQHGIPAPAFEAKLPPVIEVAGLTADLKQSVDR